MKPVKRDLTQEQLMGLFDYDSDNGKLLRRNFSNGLFIGLTVAGGGVDGDYRRIEINNINYLEHRLIWLYVKGVFPSDQLDHINKNRTDNRILNLREVNNSENQKNTTLRSSNNSGIMGVHSRSDNGKWSVRISHKGKRYTLGSFYSFLDACCVRKSAEARFGYHENHGRKT